MSSRSAAVLARAILFQLEALEPRRFLSGDAVEPVTIDPGGTQLSGSFAGGSIVRVAFQAEASAHYVFYKRSPNFIQMSILSEDGEESLAVAAPTELHQFLNRVDWTAPTTGTYLLELAKIADPYEGRLYTEYKLNVRVASDEVGDVVTQAVPIHDHEDVNGFIDSIDDSDWYSFNVEAGRLYRVARGYYEDDDWKGWVDFSLYNTDGVTEISSEEEYDFVFRATETGTYYLRAFTSARWSAADKYRLRVDSQVEPGYTPQTALD